MSQLNANLTRWITASINNHFETELSPAGYYRYYEGMSNRQTQNAEDYFEIRYDGPHLSEVSKGYWTVYVEINILSTVRVDKSVYQIDVLNGHLVNAFTAGPIHIYRYGPANPPDDGTLIGCLDLLQEGKHRLEVNRLGIIDKDKRLHQAMVEGHYKGYLELPS